MHKYWARKPHNVVSEYVKNYSKKGEIVLDPFSGSGVTAIEAIRAGRKAVAFDLNPMSIQITKMTAMPADISKIKSTFDEIKCKCKEDITNLYLTRCKKCSKPATILATIWDKTKNKPVELRYYCDTCKSRSSKEPENEDLELLKKIENMKIPFWYPETRLAYNGKDFVKKEKSDYIKDLYTKRNLVALSILHDQIEKIKDSKTQEFFKFAFTSMVHLASKMCPVAKPSERSHWSKFSSTSFWALQSYWIPPINMESNVWMLFESAICGKQGLINGKTDSNETIARYKEAKQFEDLNDDSNIFIKRQNVLELDRAIPANSVDYIFTDPPYGGAVQYFELSTLWASWLRLDMDYLDEITINSQQSKDFDYYHNMLKAAFTQMYKILKPGRYLTVTFHSTDIKIWNSILKAVVFSGFDLEKIVYQPPARASAKGLMQPYGSAVGDYYLRFRKPKTEKLVTDKQLDHMTYERTVVNAATRIIEERGEPTTYQHILNGIMVQLNGGRDAPLGARGLEDVLKNNTGEGKKLSVVNVTDEKGKRMRMWWLNGVPLTRMRPALSERVDRAVVDVLKRRMKASFDDVLQEIFIQFPNAVTPDTDSVISSLEEYADKTPDGMWRLKPKVVERESQHTSMIYLLAMIGKRCGYDVWIGHKEQADSYQGKKLSDLCDFDYEPNIKLGLTSHEMERVKQIDVIWIDRGTPEYEFEVENTTGITEAFVRGSNLPQTTYPMKRYIVLPDEREHLMRRKMKEPMITEAMKENGWKVLYYDALLAFSEKNKNAKKMDAKEIESLVSKFKTEDEHKQTKLSEMS